jgi:exodeoxyribonuclease VII small subunit
MTADATGGARTPVENMSFEELLDELTEVTAQMDDGTIGIEQAADLYERASALHAAASARLVGVRARLDELRGVANG